MNEHLISYKTAARESEVEPTCVGIEPRAHCWHNPAGFVGSSMGGFDQVCCWCGIVKQTRPNPNAHGQYQPGRHDTYGGWALGQPYAGQYTGMHR